MRWPWFWKHSGSSAGGVARAGPALFEPLRAEVRRRAFKPAVDACRIVPGVLTGTAESDDPVLATGGGIDYVLKVVARDVDAYQRLIDRLLVEDVGIDRYFTYVVTKPVKQAGVLPIERLMEPDRR